MKKNLKTFSNIIKNIKSGQYLKISLSDVGNTGLTTLPTVMLH